MHCIEIRSNLETAWQTKSSDNYIIRLHSVYDTTTFLKRSPYESFNPVFLNFSGLPRTKRGINFDKKLITWLFRLNK